MTTRQNINIETLEGFRDFLKNNPDKGKLHLEAKAVYEGQAGRSMIHVGPYAVVTILRMFDLSPIETVFEKNGFSFGAVPGVRLPQRRFADGEERRKVLSLLHDRGIDTKDWEDGGKQYADLYIAAPAGQFPLLLDRMSETRVEHDSESEVTGYICR